MKIVIDTNVVMSALYFGGNPLKIISLMKANRFDVYATPKIIEEYHEVYERLEVKTGRKANRFSFENILSDLKIIADDKVHSLSRDKDDDKFINCALNCKALYIVSGDNDLLVLKEIEDVKIVTCSQFLKLIEE